jgi:DNA-3-methyladenine glycosylase I
MSSRRPGLNPDLHTDHSGVVRCRWCVAEPIYLAYHDTEWGLPQTDDHRLFEKICLEGFQTGLSWLTILRKRERFREVFHGFDPERVVRLTKRDVDRLVKDAGIIRHRGKIESTINNARRCLELFEEFGSLYDYLRQSPCMAIPGLSAPRSMREVPAKTEASTMLSKDLRQRGWTFVGPTTIYAFLQATGFVNDHLLDCDVREQCAAAQRKALSRSRS